MPGVQGRGDSLQEAVSYPLYPHQIAAESILRGGSAVLHWEMRLGKTRTVLHAYSEEVSAGRAQDLIFVTVAMAKATIAQEVELMGLGIPVVTLYGRKQKKMSLDAEGLAGVPRIFILNWEILPEWQQELKRITRNPILVLDESHLYLRNIENKRWQAAHWLSKFAKRTWELTGTMMVNSAMDIYYQMMILGRPRNPFAYMSPGEFAKRFTNQRWNAYAQGRQGDWEPFGIKNQDRLAEMARSSLLQLRISDVAPDLPLPRNIPRWVTDLGQGWDFDRSDLELHEEIEALAPIKARLTAEYVTQLPFRPVVVFGWSRTFTQQASVLLEAPLINGSTPAADRERIRGEFQTGRHPVLVGNYRALGLGISLSRANHFVYGEPYWDASLYRQAASRGVDLSKQTQTVHHHLLAAGSVDEFVWKRKLLKGAAIDRLEDAFREKMLE